MDEMKSKIGLLEQLIKIMSAEEVKGHKAKKSPKVDPAVVAVEVTEEPVVEEVPVDPKDAIVEELFNKKPCKVEDEEEEDDEDEEDY
jgi:hypothetical protein